MVESVQRGPDTRDCGAVKIYAASRVIVCCGCGAEWVYPMSAAEAVRWHEAHQECMGRREEMERAPETGD